MTDEIATNQNNLAGDRFVQNDTQDLKPNKKKYKVMIVEDENDPRFVFKTILSTIPDLEIFDAVDGTDCLEKLSLNKDIDLVLLDIVMPTMDGIQTLTEIKKAPEKYGNPKVVMLSNLGGPVAFETAQKLGAIDFWMKIDTDPTTLINKIKQVLTDENYKPDGSNMDKLI